MKNILASIILSLACGIVVASPLTDSLNDDGASYLFNSANGSLTIFENTIDASRNTNQFIKTLCDTSEVNKIRVIVTVDENNSSTTTYRCN